MLDKNSRYILASASPRRKELFGGLGVPFTVELCGECDESYPENMEPHDIPEYISGKKADAFTRPLEEDEVLITADTMVLCEDRILGKPHNREEALEMLGFLSGKSHEVLTGVTIRTASSGRSFTSSTMVKFKKLSDEEIAFYVDTCKPYDKAGSYGVQEWIGYIGITGIDGSFYNVMGLPVQKLYEELSSL